MAEVWNTSAHIGPFMDDEPRSIAEQTAELIFVLGVMHGMTTNRFSNDWRIRPQSALWTFLTLGATERPSECVS